MAQLLGEARRLILSILPPRLPGRWRGALVTTVHENSFEYPGLHLVWRLAHELEQSSAPQHAFLYFHTKGMVHHGFLTQRVRREAELFNYTVMPWREIAAEMAGNTSVALLGLYPSAKGHIWFNFWWARASYLQTVEEPTRPAPTRYFYEGWVRRVGGGRERSCSRCCAWDGRKCRYGVVYSARELNSTVFQRER